MSNSRFALVSERRLLFGEAEDFKYAAEAS